jgi:hypothetical protein
MGARQAARVLAKILALTAATWPGERGGAPAGFDVNSSCAAPCVARSVVLQILAGRRNRASQSDAAIAVLERLAKQAGRRIGA